MSETDTLPQWSEEECRRVIAAYDNKIVGEVTDYDNRMFKHAWACLDSRPADPDGFGLVCSVPQGICFCNGPEECPLADLPAPEREAMQRKVSEARASAKELYADGRHADRSAAQIVAAAFALWRRTGMDFDLCFRQLRRASASALAGGPKR